MKGLVFAFQIDNFSSLNQVSDSSLLMMQAAHKMGIEVMYYYPNALSLSLSGPSINTAFLYDGTNIQQNHQTITKPDLSSISVILPRQNPPYDMHYLNATYILSHLRGGTKVINSTQTLQSHPEKLSAMALGHLMPPTIVTLNQQEALSFVEQYKKVVIKPLHGYGGDGVFYAEHGHPNNRAIINALLTSSKYYGQHIVVQKFIPEITAGDKRVLIAGNKVVGVISRTPTQGIISNMVANGSAVASCLEGEEVKTVDAILAYCKQNNIILAGVDLINGQLTEINITSPTGYKVLASLSGQDIGTEVISQITNAI